MDENEKLSAEFLSDVIDSHKTFPGHILIVDDDYESTVSIPIRFLAECSLVVVKQHGASHGMVIKARNYTRNWVRM